jgi:predicted DNA binding protein
MTMNDDQEKHTVKGLTREDQRVELHELAEMTGIAKST